MTKFRIMSPSPCFISKVCSNQTACFDDCTNADRQWAWV